MRRVYKYSFEGFYPCDRIELKIPKNARILSCQMQSKQIVLWCEVDENVTTHEKRAFAITFTGSAVPSGATRFIATVQSASSGLVYHVFEYASAAMTPEPPEVQYIEEATGKSVERQEVGC